LSHVKSSKEQQLGGQIVSTNWTLWS